MEMGHCKPSALFDINHIIKGQITIGSGLSSIIIIYQEYMKKFKLHSKTYFLKKKLFVPTCTVQIKKQLTEDYMKPFHLKSFASFTDFELQLVN